MTVTSAECNVTTEISATTSEQVDLCLAVQLVWDCQECVGKSLLKLEGVTHTQPFASRLRALSMLSFMSC